MNALRDAKFHTKWAQSFGLPMNILAKPLFTRQYDINKEKIANKTKSLWHAQSTWMDTTKTQHQLIFIWNMLIAKSMHQSDVWSHHFIVIYWLASSLLLSIILYLHTFRSHPQSLRLLPQLPCPNAWIIKIANFSSFIFFILFFIPSIHNCRPTMATEATNENLHMNYDWHKWSKTSIRELLIIIAFFSVYLIFVARFYSIVCSLFSVPSSTDCVDYVVIYS